VGQYFVDPGQQGRHLRTAGAGHQGDAGVGEVFAERSEGGAGHDHVADVVEAYDQEIEHRL